MLKLIIVAHVICGITALITGLFAASFRNKYKIHKVFGKIYFWCMTFIFISGVFLSLYRKNMFFFFISFFVFYSLIRGIRALKTKSLHLDGKVSKIDWGIEIIAGILHLGFVAFGAIWLIQGDSNGFIPIIFGGSALVQGAINIRKYINKPTFTGHWLEAHITGMCGSFIGACTAFLVNQSAHIPLPNLFIWLGPTLVLTPFIFAVQREAKKRFV